MQLSMRTASSGRVAARSRAQTVRVSAKVTKSPSDPRIVRGTCFVTKDVRVVAAVALGLKKLVFVPGQSDPLAPDACRTLTQIRLSQQST